MVSAMLPAPCVGAMDDLKTQAINKVIADTDFGTVSKAAADIAALSSVRSSHTASSCACSGAHVRAAGRLNQRGASRWLRASSSLLPWPREVAASRTWQAPPLAVCVTSWDRKTCDREAPREKKGHLYG